MNQNRSLEDRNEEAGDNTKGAAEGFSSRECGVHCCFSRPVLGFLT